MNWIELAALCCFCCKMKSVVCQSLQLSLLWSLAQKRKGGWVSCCLVSLVACCLAAAALRKAASQIESGHFAHWQPWHDCHRLSWWQLWQWIWSPPTTCFSTCKAKGSWHYWGSNIMLYVLGKHKSWACPLQDTISWLTNSWFASMDIF